MQIVRVKPGTFLLAEMKLALSNSELRLNIFAIMKKEKRKKIVLKINQVKAWHHVVTT